MRNMRKVGGVAVLIGGKFNKKVIREDKTFLDQRVHVLYTLSQKFRGVTGDCIHICETTKKHEYEKTEQVDKYGRVMYIYKNIRKRNNGVLPEYMNNKNVIELNNRFNRIKQQLEIPELNQSVRDMLLVEYNEILKNLIRINNH